MSNKADRDLVAEMAAKAESNGARVALVVYRHGDVTPPTDWEGFMYGAMVSSGRVVEGVAAGYVDGDD